MCRKVDGYIRMEQTKESESRVLNVPISQELLFFDAVKNLLGLYETTFLFP